MAVTSPDMIADNSPRDENPAGRAAFLTLILAGIPFLLGKYIELNSHYQIDRSFGPIVVLRLQEGIKRK